MAKIRSGILGNIRGKVSGVVGGQWKDINYLREYVKPANPNTTHQQTQRTKMSDELAFCKPLVGPIFNAYTDKFQKSMSGFNRFIKSNIAEFDGSPDYSLIVLSEGSLFPISTFAATYNAGDGEMVATWVKDLGNNGAITDATYTVAYDSSTGLWYYGATEITRNTETSSITLPTGLTPANINAYILAARKSGDIVTLISDSVHDECVAP